MKTWAIGRVGAHADNHMRHKGVFPPTTKVWLSHFWTSTGFKAAHKQLMGGTTRNLAVVASNNTTDKDWDSPFNLHYVAGLTKHSLELGSPAGYMACPCDGDGCP